MTDKEILEVLRRAKRIVDQWAISHNDLALDPFIDSAILELESRKTSSICAESLGEYRREVQAQGLPRVDTTRDSAPKCGTCEHEKHCGLCPHCDCVDGYRPPKASAPSGDMVVLGAKIDSAQACLSRGYEAIPAYIAELERRLTVAISNPQAKGAQMRQFTRSQIKTYLESWRFSPAKELGPQSTIFVHEMLEFMFDKLEKFNNQPTDQPAYFSGPPWGESDDFGKEHPLKEAIKLGERKAFRVNNYESRNEKEVCYWKHSVEGYFICFPAKREDCPFTVILGGLKLHDITEHFDGTISVSPSILTTSRWGDREYEIHGYLTNDIWRDA